MSRKPPENCFVVILLIARSILTSHTKIGDAISARRLVSYGVLKAHF